MKHRKILTLCLLILLCAVNLGHASAIASIGHFDDTSWAGLGNSGGYNDISVDVTIDVWNGGSDAYYYSNNASFTNGKNIYGGLQTNGYDGSKWIGKMAIFSIWDVTSGIAEPGGTGVPFGGEGVGYSVRIPYNWSAGVSYRLKIYLDQDAASGNRLWGASITNLANGQTARIGRIYVPVGYGKVSNPVTFHERYTGGTDTCADMSPSQVSFTNMTANSGTVRASSWNHYVKKSLPECPGNNWFVERTAGYTNGINTTKPAAQAAAAPPSAAPKPTTPAPTATQTVQAPTADSADEPVTINDPKPAPVAQKKSSKLPKFLLAGFALLLLIAAAAGYKMRKFLHNKKILAKHFVHDFDIHGPRFT